MTVVKLLEPLSLQASHLFPAHPVRVRNVSVGGVAQPGRREGDGRLLGRAQVHPDGPADHAVAEDERDEGHEEVRDREPRDIGLKQGIGTISRFL